MVKKYLISALLLSWASMVQALDISVLVSRFFATQSPYAEIYFHAVASTINPVEVLDSMEERQVKILVIFKQDDKIVRFDNFLLSSGLTSHVVDFTAVKRYGLEPGTYQLSFECTDVADESNVYKDSTELIISPQSSLPTVSDIQLFADSRPSTDETLSKHGYIFELIPFGFVNARTKKVGLYFESYRTDILDTTYVNYQITLSKEDGKGAFQVMSRSRLKRPAGEMDVIVTECDLSFMESGRYRLSVLMQDDKRSPLDSSAYYFVNSNPERDAALMQSRVQDAVTQSFVGRMDVDSLNYALRAIAMNVPFKDVEILNYIIQGDSKAAKANFLYNYCISKSTVFPEEFFNKYMEVARAVDKKYRAGLGFGFETDRGNIFMKYGAPSDMITILDDPSAPPYEVWLYYSIPQLRQSNVKFLFYNPFMDNADYRLLQSNARGEIQNKHWKKELYKVTKSEQPMNLAPEKWDIKDSYNRQAGDWLDDL